MSTPPTNPDFGICESPGAASITRDFSTNRVFGDQTEMPVTWSTSLDSFVVYLHQENPGGGATRGAELFKKEKTRIDPRAFNWTISVDTPLRASDSNIYFLWWVSEANNEEGFTSGYFNITGAAPSTTDVSSATTPVSTNTNNAPTTPAPPTPTPPNPASPVPPPAAAGNSDSSALRIGLGVGLGVGIPIVILLAVGVFFMLKYLKRLTPAKPKDAAAVENEPLDKYTYGHVADQQEIDGYAAAAVTPYDPPSELPGGGTLSGRSELPER